MRKFQNLECRKRRDVLSLFGGRGIKKLTHATPNLPDSTTTRMNTLNLNQNQSPMTNTVYSELIRRFPASADLLSYLKSAEGGRLSVRTPPDAEGASESEKPYVVISYDKGTANMDVPHVEYFRSVVWDTVKNRPVSAAPSRGRAFSTASACDGPWVVEDFVDGIMLNMFWDGMWRLASRTNLDAKVGFYGKRSFAELFWETADAMSLNKDNLNTSRVYSWVLQHPSERIVVALPNGKPKLFLVEESELKENGDQVVFRDVDLAFREFQPTRHAVTTLDEVNAHVESWGKNAGYLWQGVVLKNLPADGKQPTRWKLRTEKYETARKLRGNQSKLPFLWLERFKERKLTAYLAIYSEEDTAANAVIESFKACTKELHRLYDDVYRKKLYPLGKAPQKYRKLLWEIHLDRKGAYFPHVREFMNGQDTARKLWLVNYEARYGATGTPALPASPPQEEDTVTIDADAPVASSKEPDYEVVD
jgi:hypothetical protein